MSLKTVFLTCIFSFSAFAADGDIIDSSLSTSHPSKVVLNLDGGGIRGIFSLKVLSAVAEDLPHPLDRYVDLYSGTSTGGMIALSLAMGKSIDEALHLYTEKGDEVFYAGFWHKVRSGFGLIDEKYSVSKFEPLLKDFYGHKTKLSDIQYADALAISVDLTDGIVKQFSTFDARKNPANDMLVWEVARSTSAAPTYFEPVNSDNHAIVDGGLVANNPSIEAAILMKQQYGWETYQHLKSISLGTGNYYARYTFQNIKDWGVAQWAAPISSVMMSVDSNSTHQNMVKLYPDKNQYIRLNTRLDEDIALDGITASEIEKIQTAALTYIQENPQDIDQARKILLNNGVK